MSEHAFTENGDKAFLTTGDKNLDFFTRITRDAPIEDVINTFLAAWSEDSSTAIEVLMNLRDPRKGKQEKSLPIIILVHLKFTAPPKVYESILNAMLPYGCWKDLLKIHEISTRLVTSTAPKLNKQQQKLRAKMNIPSTTASPSVELTLFAQQLQTDYDAITSSDETDRKTSISLAAKWAPSEKSHHDHHPMFAAKTIKTIMGISSKMYRTMLKEMRAHLNVLEMLMATQQYDKIDFSKIPAAAMKKMNKAFKRDTNSEGIESEGRKKLHLSYADFMAKLSKGETKINVAGIQPHELVEAYYSNRNTHEIDQLVEEQWKTIMQRVLEKGSFNKVTAIVDVSGSMEGVPMQVAIALGIMVADCTTGPFANQVITFHSSPTWYKLNGDTLMEKVQCLKRAPWGGNTNLRATFDLILNEATRYQLTPDQMVNTLFVFTDMQFDSAFTGSTTSSFEDIKLSFENAGYTMPKIVFWNLRSSDTKTLPVMKNEENVALLSGFSAELLNCIIDAKEFTPLTIMQHVLSPYLAPKDVRNCTLAQFPHNISVLQKAVESSQIKKSFKEINFVPVNNDTL